jgi:hypothetical protein
MTFDEFFKKKRIDLTALQKAEPALFSEFKTHYEQMGEKSFDHTKKYWFNKTRREFPLAIEVKTEKPHIANPLAEQTITESLSETQLTAPSPKVGFTPRFKAGAMSKPAEPIESEAAETPAPINEVVEEKPAAPKVGFTPRFKAGVTAKAAVPVENKVEETLAKPDEITAEKPAEDKPKVGFTPRFKAGVTKPVAPKAEDNIEETKPVEPAIESPLEEGSKEIKPAAYKPRFNMKNIPPKPPEEQA